MSGMWSTGDSTTSGAASKSDRSSLGYGSMEQNVKPSDMLWDLGLDGASAASASFLQEQAMMDNLYSTPSREPPMMSSSSSGSSGSAKDRLHYTKHLYQGMEAPDFLNKNSFPTDGRGDGKDASPKFGDMPLMDHLKSADFGNTGPSYGSNMCGTYIGAGNAYSSSNSGNSSIHGMSGGGYCSNGAMGSNSHVHSQCGPSHANTMETWSNQGFQEALSIDRNLLAQALSCHHITQQQLEMLAAKELMAANKDKMFDASHNMQDQVDNPHLDKEGMTHTQQQGRNFMQPIRVMTQNNNNGYNNNQTMQGWSSPNTTNSTSDSVPGFDSKSNMQMSNPRLQLLQHKGFPPKFSPGQSPHNHSPNAAYDKHAYFNRGGMRGQRYPFFPRQRHHSDNNDLKQAAAAAMVAAAAAAAANGERFPPPKNDHHSPPESSNHVNKPGFSKDFSAHSRSHFIEDFLPPDYPGFPPPPLGGPFGKVPPNLPPHLQGSPPFGPDGMEYYPPYDPYFHGRMTPTFFGPNDMFFDMIPPHFYGMTHFFPGFKPPR